MKIKVHIHLTHSERDTYGNVYTIAEVTNNETGEKFTFYDDGNNGSYYLRKAGFEWSEISTSEEVLPIRQHDREMKKIRYISTEEIISKLENWK